MTTEIGIILTAIGTIVSAITVWLVRAAKIHSEAVEKKRQADWQEFRDAYSESNDVLRADRDYYRDAYFNGLCETNAEIAALKLEQLETKRSHEAEIASVRLELVEAKVRHDQENAIAKSRRDELEQQVRQYRDKVAELEAALRQSEKERETERVALHAEIDSLRANIAGLLPKQIEESET